MPNISKAEDKLYNYDPMGPGSGAFKSLTREMDFQPHRGGDTFAISGSFPYLNIASAMSQHASHYYDNNAVEIDQWLDGLSHHLRGQSNAQLYFPSQEAASASKITPSAGVGGLAHEAGHAIYDMCGHAPRLEEMKPLVKPYLEKLQAERKLDSIRGLHQWVNVCADIRLERMSAHDFPNLQTRF